LFDFRDTEDLLELEGSKDWMGVSASAGSGEGGIAFMGLGFGSFSEDAALVGRDFGDDSPAADSWVKKLHFFADFGVDGTDVVAAAASRSSGIELRLFGV
jgi:hypothetical protein